MSSKVLLLIALICILSFVDANSRRKLRKHTSHKKTHTKKNCGDKQLQGLVANIDAGSSGTRINLFEERWVDKDDDNNCQTKYIQVCQKSPKGKKYDNALLAEEATTKDTYTKSKSLKLGDVFLAAKDKEGEAEVTQAHKEASEYFIGGLKEILSFMFKKDGEQQCADIKELDTTAANLVIVLASTAGSRKDMVGQKKSADLLQQYFSDFLKDDGNNKLTFKNQKDADVKVLEEIFAYDVISGRFEGLFGWLSMYLRMEENKDNEKSQYHRINICGKKIDGTPMTSNWQDCLRRIVYFEQGGASSQITFPVINDNISEECKQNMIQEYPEEPASEESASKNAAMAADVNNQDNEAEASDDMIVYLKSQGDHVVKQVRSWMSAAWKGLVGRRMRNAKKSHRLAKKHKKSKGFMEFTSVGTVKNLISLESAEKLNQKQDTDKINLRIFSKSWLGNGSNEMEEILNSNPDTKQHCFNPKDDPLNDGERTTKYDACMNDVKQGFMSGNPKTDADRDLLNFKIDQQWRFVKEALKCSRKDMTDLSILMFNGKAAYFRVKNNKDATQSQGLLTKEEMQDQKFKDWPVEENKNVLLKNFKWYAKIACGLPWMEKKHDESTDDMRVKVMMKNSWTISACLCSVMPEAFSSELGFTVDNTYVFQDDWAPGCLKYNQVENFVSANIHQATMFHPVQTHEKEDANYSRTLEEARRKHKRNRLNKKHQKRHGRRH